MSHEDIMVGLIASTYPVTPIDLYKSMLLAEVDIGACSDIDGMAWHLQAQVTR